MDEVQKEQQVDRSNDTWKWCSKQNNNTKSYNNCPDDLAERLYKIYRTILYIYWFLFVFSLFLAVSVQTVFVECVQIDGAKTKPNKTQSGQNRGCYKS